jgi:peptidoglycan/xylan/chitin deacetylase (PgdA/CDA1 family)
MWNDSVIEAMRASPRPVVELDEFGLGQVVVRTIEEKRAAVDALLARLKFLAPAVRDAAVCRVQDLAGVPALPDDLMLQSSQLRGLHRAGMEIGAHTVRHPILTSIGLPECEREFTQGRDRLQEIIEAPVTVLAYPNGKPGRDYDLRHVSLAQRLGFSGAVTTAPGVARPGDDIFQLPRFTPWGRGPAAWSTRLLLNQRKTRFEKV